MILEDVLKEVLNRRKDRDHIWNAIQHNEFTYKGPIRDQLLFIEKIYSCNDKLMEEEVRDVIVSVFGEEPEEKEEIPQELPGYQSRMIDEFKELHERIMYLDSFFDTDTFRELDNDDKDTLSEQLDVMYLYEKILVRRLKKLGFSIEDILTEKDGDEHGKD